MLIKKHDANDKRVGIFFGQERLEGSSDLSVHLKLFLPLALDGAEVGILGFSSPKVSTEASPPPRLREKLHTSLLLDKAPETIPHVGRDTVSKITVNR